MPAPVIAYLFTTFPQPTETFLQREIIAMKSHGVNLRLYSLWGGGGTFLRIVMTGFDEGIRWRRYLDRATAQWQRGLGVLKMLLER